jgi:D-alanine-D-alanine ligase-like ATP-grasp enzyme
MNASELTGKKLSRSNWMIVLEAYERGVWFTKLPKERFEMSYGDKKYVVKNGKILREYNSKLAVRVMGMKEVSSRLLRSRGHAAPENTVFQKNDLERAWNWAKPILPVVVKPYNGQMGNLVFVNIDSYEEFKQCFEKVTEKHETVLVEQFIKGNEYRFTYVNNQIVGVANRVPANIVGDGENTIKQLVVLKNEERESRKNPIHKQLPLDEESERVLAKKGYSFEYIPEAGETVYLRNNSNVSTGGDAIDVTDKISRDIKNRVRKAIRSIPGIEVCGVDVLINGDDINILEVNLGPMLSMHHHPWEGKKRNVIGKVVDGMFPETVGK